MAKQTPSEKHEAKKAALRLQSSDKEYWSLLTRCRIEDKRSKLAASAATRKEVAADKLATMQAMQAAVDGLSAGEAIALGVATSKERTQAHEQAQALAAIKLEIAATKQAMQKEEAEEAEEVQVSA